MASEKPGGLPIPYRAESTLAPGKIFLDEMVEGEGARVRPRLYCVANSL